MPPLSTDRYPVLGYVFWYEARMHHNSGDLRSRMTGYKPVPTVSMNDSDGQTGVVCEHRYLWGAKVCAWWRNRQRPAFMRRRHRQAVELRRCK